MDDICNIAAENGHLECLKYSHENGGKCNEITSANACESNSLDILRYLHRIIVHGIKRHVELQLNMIIYIVLIMLMKTGVHGMKKQ